MTAPLARRLVRRLPSAVLREKAFYALERVSRGGEGELEAALTFGRGVTLRLRASDVAHRAIATTGFYELAVSRRIARLAEAGGLFVDVGANVGYFSTIWASARPDNRALALEASPPVAAALRANVRANRVGERVEVLEVAAGAAAATLPFWLGPPDQTGWGGLASGAAEGTVEVPVERIDAVLAARGVDAVAVLKVDAEGADPWVLEGARGLLERGAVGHVFYEVNGPRTAALGLDEGAAHAVLRSCGYAPVPLGGGDWMARRPA